MEQFKSGIRAQDVKCGEDLVLMIKAENGFPACVMPQTAQKLVERGWGILANHESQQTSVMPSIHPSSMSCQISYPQTGTGTAVLFMPLNTTGKICVQYSNSNRPQPAGIKIFNAQDMSKDAQNISVTMDHDLIPIGNSTIMYTITTDNHATFYGISLFCGGIPFAVGYDNSSTIVKDDFPWVGQAFNCPSQTYDSHIVGLTGIGVRYIPYS